MQVSDETSVGKSIVCVLYLGVVREKNLITLLTNLLLVGIITCKVFCL